MAADSVSSDGDDDRIDLGAFHADLIRAVATPALTASLVALDAQVQDLAASVSRTLAAQVAPVALAAQRQQEELVREFAGAVLSKQRLDEALRPISEEIAAAQIRWASALAVPVMAQARLTASIAGLVVTPELTAALDRINDVVRVRMVFPDGDGIARLDSLITSGDVDADILAAAEAGVASDAELSAAIGAAADVLAAARPWIPRERARQLVTFWVWAMVRRAVGRVGTGAAGGRHGVGRAMGAPATNTVAGRAREEFDRRYPPADGTDRMERSSTPRRRLLLRTGNCFAAVDDQVSPVSQEAASHSRKAAALAVSSGRPSRFIG